MPVQLLVVENAARPVARVVLIPELFAAIMHRALDVYPPFISSHIRHVEDRPLGVQVLGAAVIASHVCSMWRTLCIGTPTLWARQIGLLPRAIVEFLARSRDALLHVDWNSRRHAGYWPASAYVQPFRLAGLLWKNDQIPMPNIAMAFLRTVLSGSLTNLTTLVLWEMQWDDLGLTHTIDVPQLVHMHLHDVRFEAQFAFNAPKLESLKAFHCDIPHASIIETLQCTPALNTLVIDRCTIAVVEGQQRQHVDLPELRFISLSLGYSGGLGADALCQLLSPLHVRPQKFRIILDGEWTESLVALCLHNVFLLNAPSCLLIEEDLQSYPTVSMPPAPLPPKMVGQDICARIAYPYLPWLAEVLPALKMHDVLSNLTTLVMITGSAQYLRRSPVLVRSLLSALPSIETYWVLNSSFGQHPDGDVDVRAVYDCLIRGLAPGPIVSDQTQLVPFPHLRTLGLCVSSSDSAQFFRTVAEVFASRVAAGVPTLQSLSLSWAARASHDNDAAVAQLLSVIPTIHWGTQPSPG